MRYPQQHDSQPSRRGSAAIHEALSYVASSGMPAHHKTVLIEIIEDALAKAEREAPASAIAAVPDGNEWRPDEVQVIATHLEGKVAASWQNADELLMLLAKRLKHSPEEIKTKATQLGFGAGIDYRVAKASARTAKTES